MIDRILLAQKIGVGREIFIKGPPLEALRFQGVRVGRIVTLTDAEGNDFRGRVTHLSKEKASILIFDLFSSSTESPLRVILLQALPEKERMELIVQKATELGVSMIIPFESERSISLKERESKQEKAHRWQNIAIKAVKQSRRARVPLIEACRSFKEALEAGEDGLKIMLWEKEGGKLKDILRQHCPSRPSLLSFEKRDREKFEDRYPSKIYAMVGPEGGFAEEEVKQAQEKGFIPVKLGQRILRTETAAITLVGILQYELGDLS